MNVSRNDNTPYSHSKGSWFESQEGLRLPCLMFFLQPHQANVVRLPRIIEKCREAVSSEVKSLK